MTQQTPLVTPNPAIIGLPGPVQFNGDEWVNFRQKGQGVTAPLSVVESQITLALPAVSALTGGEVSNVVQGGAAAKATTAQIAGLAKQDQTIVVKTATEAALRAAAVQCAAFTTCTILMPSATITLTSPLPVPNYVRWQGQQPVITLNTLVPDNPGTFPGGGTVLKGDGTFPAFAANNQGATTAKSAAAGYGLDSIVGAQFDSIAFDTFTSAFAIGSTNLPGLTYGKISRIWTRGMTSWAEDLQNAFHTDVDQVWNWLPANSATPFAAGFHQTSSSPAASLMPGNMQVSRVYTYQGNPLGRCNVAEAVPGAILNEVRWQRVQCNAFRNGIADQTATFTSGSSSVAVSDGTQYIVGLPVHFPATGAGFNALQAYFITGISGNNLTLGNCRSCAAITATASTTGTIQSRGMPDAEFVGQDTTASVTQSSYDNADLEGTAEIGLLLDSAPLVKVHVSETDISKQNNSVVIRNSYVPQITSLKEATIDIDGASANTQLFGSRSATRQRLGVGIWYDKTNDSPCLTLIGSRTASSGVGVGQQGDMCVKYTNSTTMIGFATNGPAFGEKIAGAALTAGGTLSGYAGTLLLNPSSPQTWNLPTAACAAVNSCMIGLPLRLINIGTATAAITTDGTQLFNQQSGKTSISIPAGASVDLVAGVNGSTYFWIARLGGAS